MNPYAFEELCKKLLECCEIRNIKVTPKSHDDGIDGVGELKLNGLFSMDIAFQCKRYQDSNAIGPAKVQEFRGALPNNVERGLFITTGRFTNGAKQDAARPDRKKIDLMDGEELIDKLIQFQIGIKKESVYIVDEDFFKSNE